MLKIERPCNDKDFHEIADLFREYQQAIGADLCFQGFEQELATLPGKYAPPRGALFLALIDDKPVGCVALRPHDEFTAEMKRLYVRPSARKTGLGRTLAELALQEARALGYKHMVLDTLGSMREAVALYRSLGFVETTPYTENPLPEPMFFRLLLRPA